MIAQAAFIAMALAASAASAATMTGPEAREICDDVARLESEGRLDALVLNLSRLPTVKPTVEEQALIDQRHLQPAVRDIFRLEIDKGRPVLFVSVSDGGTCANHSIYPVAKQTDEPSEGEEASFGGEDWILVRDERFFFINRELGSGRLRDLAWITPTGGVQRMCSFETQRVVRSVATHRAPLALCEALLHASASARWRPYENFAVGDPEALKQLRQITGVSSRYDSTPQMQAARIDVDNDGHIDELVRLNFTNSSGCGVRGSRIQVFDSARDRIADDPLNALLHMTSTNGDPVEIYTVAARQYVLAHSETEGRVYPIGAKGAEEQCVIAHRPVLRAVMHLNGKELRGD